jgi:NAD(P)H-dependent flavin oxidoreductase YrpB (nitropropane dioxygenase family)
MDGAGIAAVLRLGASAAQLGTAFIACAESIADAGYREALAGDAANHTVMTRAISGRPARCLRNRFTVLGAGISPHRSTGCARSGIWRAVGRAGCAARQGIAGCKTRGRPGGRARTRFSGRRLAAESRV